MEGCHGRFKPCCNDFVVKKVSKVFSFFMLPFTSSFKIFINVFTFLYVKANSKEIGEEILFPSFFRKMLMSAFLLRFRANYLAKCVATPIFLLDSNSLYKDLLFPHGANLAQNPPYLVGTVLKS